VHPRYRVGHTNRLRKSDEMEGQGRFSSLRGPRQAKAMGRNRERRWGWARRAGRIERYDWTDTRRASLCRCAACPPFPILLSSSMVSEKRASLSWSEPYVKPCHNPRTPSESLHFESPPEHSTPFTFLPSTLTRLQPQTTSSKMSVSTQVTEHTSPREDRDLATQSNYHDIRTTHLDLTWTINWTSKLISGSVYLTLEATKEDVDFIILDTSHLDIQQVEIGGKEVRWSLGEKVVEIMGRGIKIELPPGGVKKGGKVDVMIEYSTTKECTAVGWLNPE